MKSMTTVFVDSNVVIYSLDRRSPEKRRGAQAWLSQLGPSDLLTMSPQVLNEAYAVLTLKHGLDPVSDGVRATLARFERWVTAPLDFNTILAGWALQDRYGLRIWDALLLASANAVGSTLFLTEDLNDGQIYGGVRAINPFRHEPQDVLGRASRN
jgi:predicted nucleic acid-binding protein